MSQHSFKIFQFFGLIGCYRAFRLHHLTWQEKSEDTENLITFRTLLILPGCGTTELQTGLGLHAFANRRLICGSLGIACGACRLAYGIY